jgi:hypothetical protein
MDVLSGVVVGGPNRSAHKALAWHGSPSGGDVATVRRPFARVAVAMSATLLLSCASEPSCSAPDADSPDCHDLTLNDVEYDEWRTVEKPPITQELGDGRYPACNRGSCGLEGWGTTDVWLVDGVDPTVALMGYREGTEVAVIFVRVGTDPEDVELSIDPGVLE